MQTLVTGGAGFIGSHLVDALLARGDAVTIVDDLSSGRESNLAGALAAGARLERADVRDGAALAGPRGRRRARGRSSTSPPRSTCAGRSPTRRMTRARTSRARSTCSRRRARPAPRAWSSPRPAARSTATPTCCRRPRRCAALPMAAYGAEQAVRRGSTSALYERLDGLSTIALRFGNVYGPRQDPHGEAGVIAIFCGRLKAGGAPKIFGDGSQTRDYVYVGDLVEALMRAGATRDSGVVNIGTEEETSVLELVGVLSRLHGPDTPAPEFAPARLGELDRSCLDAGRARELLGWRAGTPIAEGLRLTYEALDASAARVP